MLCNPKVLASAVVAGGSTSQWEAWGLGDQPRRRSPKAAGLSVGSLRELFPPLRDTNTALELAATLILCQAFAQQQMQEV